MSALEQARAALRVRQGGGARYDDPAAPADTLGWARLGTAYFARLLNNLSDQELDAASRVAGWSRRHVVAQVGYQARALTRLTQWAATGKPEPMYASASARMTEIENGATLPARALRGLFRHAAVHLDVEWRDLPARAWDARLVLPDDRLITARETGWIRAREIWVRSVDLGSDGSFLHMPPALLDRLLAEAMIRWSGPPLTLRPIDRAQSFVAGADGVAVSGKAGDLAAWLTGRGARRLTCNGPLPAEPAPDLMHSF